MNTERSDHFLDLLIREGPKGLREVALAADSLTIQWHSVPVGAFRAMGDLLQDRYGDFLEVKVGRMFGDALVSLTRREGIVSVKLRSESAGAELVIVHLAEPTIARLGDALVEAIEDWGE